MSPGPSGTIMITDPQQIMHTCLQEGVLSNDQDDIQWMDADGQRVGPTSDNNSSTPLGNLIIDEHGDADLDTDMSYNQ